ncbi:RTA1 like protein-domain-containing protein [Desarmillaria tabescens]|uniref:RTA1 like protein-domain-containing protein n=1 Tax=Armillaria tabescens TaxID=1929756 RepID=A0AA39NC51_ARMTA|nr:RTA1 like protein-domain-containing protein [Desarmillaria tabescens]KAK0462876.1 RTA1 like protein-domain-containing protein [Desarmillaria tabescens]
MILDQALVVARASSTGDDYRYGYTPTEYVTIIFVALFGGSTFAHTVQSLHYRLWWPFPTIILAGTLEVLGWSGRLWSSFSPTLRTPYMIQIVTTIIGPTPLVAGNFIILGGIISLLGPAYSRLSPKYYSWIFVSCDIISLIVQGAGGGIAASAKDASGATLGGNIMLGGIVFQLVVITCYAILATEFLIRYLQNRPIYARIGSTAARQSEVTLPSNEQYFRGDLSRKIKLMMIALSFNTLCLYIRAIYRTIELSDGWNGRIITTEVYFNVLDGAMVVLAIYAINFAHPGWLLGQYPANVDTKSSESVLELESRAY